MVTQIKTRREEKTVYDYDKDFYQWVKTTVEKLKQQKYMEIDWENLIEEVDSLGRSEKDKLDNLLTRLLEHLLKLAYWESEQEYNAHHWRGEIINFRIQLKKLLKSSPSLKPLAHKILPECYQDACKIVSQKSNLPLTNFPFEIMASLEQILDEDYYFS